MKKYFLLFITYTLFLGCSTNSPKNNNPYLPNYSVNLDVNMSLPAYSKLQYVSNAVFITGYGVRGIFVFNSGSGYYAFDAACPNQPISTCSTMAFKKLDPNDPLKIDVTHVICSCDAAEYSLFSGQSPGKQYPMKQYRVDVAGNIIHIYN